MISFNCGSSDLSTDVDDSIEFLVARHRELEEFSIFFADCSDRSLQSLLTLNVVKLFFMSAIITGENLNPALEYSQCLQNLTFIGCLELTDDGFASILSKSGGNLKSLIVFVSDRITLSAINSFGTSFPLLKELNLSCCRSLSDNGLISFLNKTGGNLTVLDIGGTPVTLASIDTLTTTLLHLENLGLSECHELTDVGFVNILNKVGEKLECLDLWETSIALSDLSSLTTSLPNLKKLKLGRCPDLADDGFVNILNRVGERLENLAVQETGVTLVNIGHLTINLPLLEKLNLRDCEVRQSGLMALLSRTGDSLQRLNISGTWLSSLVITRRYPGLRIIETGGSECDESDEEVEESEESEYSEEDDEEAEEDEESEEEYEEAEEDEEEEDEAEVDDENDEEEDEAVEDEA